MARKFNGTSDFAVTSSIDWSASSTLTLAFWAWIDVFTNTDELILESSSFSASNPGTFFIDPCHNGGAFKFSIELGAYPGDPTDPQWADTIVRPSAGAWHHYMWTINRATPVNLVWVDGAPATLTTSRHNAGSYGNFANLPLFLMSRGGSSLFLPGRLAELAAWPGALLGTPQAAALAAGASPVEVRPDNLGLYVPMLGDSPEPDYAGTQKSLTLSGSPTVTGHPARTLIKLDSLWFPTGITVGGPFAPWNPGPFGLAQFGSPLLAQPRSSGDTTTVTPVTATAQLPLEALQALAATAADPVEALKALTATGSDPVEALKALASTNALVVEALKALTATGSDPVEALKAITATDATVLEALKGIAATAGEQIEALKALAATGATPLEALKALTATDALIVEALKGLAATDAAVLEALKGLASTDALVFETQGTTALTSTAQLPIETLKALTATGSDPVEALKALAATDATVLEALKRLAATGQLPIETLKAVAATGATPLEALKALTATGSEPLEAGKGVALLAIVPVEALGGLRSTGQTTAETIKPLSLVGGTLPVETLKRITATDPLVIEALLRLARTASLPLDSNFTLSGITGLTAAGLSSGWVAVALIRS